MINLYLVDFDQFKHFNNDLFLNKKLLFLKNFSLLLFFPVGSTTPAPPPKAELKIAEDRTYPFPCSRSLDHRTEESTTRTHPLHSPAATPAPML